MGGRRDGRDLGDDAMREDLPMARVMDVHRVVIERRHRRHHRRHHRHRVGVVVEAVEEPQQRLVDHRVMTDAERELIELALGRQLAVQQQVAHFGEGALGGELLDRIATIQQHAGVTVDVGDLAFAGGGQPVARIEGEGAELLVQRHDVHDAGTHRSGLYRQFRLFATGAVDELELALFHLSRLPGKQARGIRACERAALHGPPAESRQRQLNNEQVRNRLPDKADHGLSGREQEPG